MIIGDGVRAELHAMLVVALSTALVALCAFSLIWDVLAAEAVCSRTRGSQILLEAKAQTFWSHRRRYRHAHQGAHP